MDADLSRSPQPASSPEAALGSAISSFTFGDEIDWSSPLGETYLYVELPFWLMMPPGPVKILWSGTEFTVDVCSPWMEVFIGEVTDSRVTCWHHGPWRSDYQVPQEVNDELIENGASWLPRRCKTMLRLVSRAHASAFRRLSDVDPPRARQEQEAYWASLCEVHLPVVNELIQRYRLTTYDYFAYEVSAWDVPVWYLKYSDGELRRAVLLPYKSWDSKPVTIEKRDKPDVKQTIRPFEWTNPDALSAASSEDATPGEFDLLDARSLMERGDYTGAVRRTVTAIEAVLAWALFTELENEYGSPEAPDRLARTDNDFPGRLAQWRRLARPQISQQEFDELASTRRMRHDIVHRGRRLVHDERGIAQRAVDTGRWLYNKIEGKPDRARLRDYGVLKSVGRVALAPRFPATLDEDGFVLHLTPFSADR